jgi:hypothetical protein
MMDFVIDGGDGGVVLRCSPHDCGSDTIVDALLPKGDEGGKYDENRSCC